MPDIPIIRVQELQLDVLKDLTMHDILEVSERHMLDAAVHLYLRRNLETGLVVGVFPPYAVILYDIEEGKNFINLKDFSDIVPPARCSMRLSRSPSRSRSRGGGG
ncbi:hypothetical protein [Methanoculleus chikugoensis]|uniref:hypothetical protein n=1 Tax=Methanoculleus chikugoensis TaxID=118126 RepID=UPI000ABC610F|nr:hypothetical protein [Methanoculleus chikugoensis]